MTNVFGYNSDNIFDQSLNTDDSVSFASVTVSDAITLSQQLATKLYVDTHGGGGGGNMTFVGGTPATNYIYKGYTSDGLNTTRSTITDDGSLVTVSTVNGITAPKIIKTGGTGIQYLMGDGSTLTQSATSGNSNFYLYQSKNGITTPPPLLGDVGYNNANQSLATIVYISHLTRDNIDIEVFYNQVNQLNDLYIQDQNNSVNFIKYNITGLPTSVINSYTAIPVLAISSGGTGATSFGSNHNVLLAFFSNLTEVDTRLSTLETNTQNQTAVSLITTFNDTVTVPIIKVQGIGSLSGNPLDSVSIGLGDFSVKLDAVNGVRAYSYALYSGTSSQFLKGDGIPDTNVYALASSVGQGMPFNSIYGNTTTAPTGTRSLWYTAITPYATTINGIMMYVDGGGSDTCHFGIYRGYLKSGVGTNPGLNMTLVGQSATSVTLSTGLPYNRVPIVVIGGQSLAFTAGSYLTIAFHASGTSNTFLSSPTGFSSVGLCYTTLTNYATTTFPATITNSSISTSSTQRICFDLY
jgi:hypothetical protein